MQKEQNRWNGWYTLALLAIVAAMVWVSVIVPLKYLKYTWILNMAFLALFTMVVGFGVTGRLSGVLIDFRLRWNLSRLQMTLWTIVVLSAFFTIAMWNIFSHQKDPLAITLQEELWLLMGISTTSLVGSPLIISGKRDKEPDKKEAVLTIQQIIKQRGVSFSGDVKKSLFEEQGPPLETDESEGKKTEELPVKTVGQLVVNTKITDAGVIDLFKGEETGNAMLLDLVRIQMFYFTIIAVISYMVSLFQMFANAAATGGKIAQLPTLSGSLLGLLAISHGGYLVSKGISHSKPGDDNK